MKKFKYRTKAEWMKLIEESLDGTLDYLNRASRRSDPTLKPAHMDYSVTAYGFNVRKVAPRRYAIDPGRSKLEIALDYTGNIYSVLFLDPGFPKAYCHEFCIGGTFNVLPIQAISFEGREMVLTLGPGKELLLGPSRDETPKWD